eukprot:6969-Heterococcus_DN1.PRE.3
MNLISSWLGQHFSQERAAATCSRQRPGGFGSLVFTSQLLSSTWRRYEQEKFASSYAFASRASIALLLKFSRLSVSNSDFNLVLVCAVPLIRKRRIRNMALMLRRSPMKLLEEFARKTVQKKPGLHSNRAQKGMYAGKDVRYGNTITFSAKKNKRRWLPNVQSKRLWSEMLNE